MPIPRKPSRDVKNVDNFIKEGAGTSTLPSPANNAKKGRRVISMSLMYSEATWIDEIVDKLNDNTLRKITRSEIVSAAISALREKSFDEISEVVKSR